MSIGAKRLQLRFEVAELVVQADRGKLRLILENLISNAIKFTPSDGTVLVRGRISREGWWQLDVADTGPGIPLGDRSRIFEPFYQADTPETSYVRGTGIGLSVVWDFVAAHGGRVVFIEGEWPGAHIRVELPLQPTENRAAEGVEKPYTATVVQYLQNT